MKNYLQLIQIADDISSFIENETKASTKLKFLLRKNLRQLQSTAEIIEEDFETLSEEKQEQLQEFQQERLGIVKEHDGDIQQLQNGTVQVTNYNELLKDKDFVKALEKLEAEYKELLNKLSDLETANNKVKREKVAEVDWVEISIDMFPEVLEGDLPDTFLDFVTE